MVALCPLSCGICTFNCTDTDEHCVSWAQDGQCEENPLMMYKECPVACGVCTLECQVNRVALPLPLPLPLPLTPALTLTLTPALTLALTLTLKP